jgi:uncharacterized protein YjbJ (UPF0337 family)
VSRKSGRRHKIEGVLAKARGRMREALGGLTGSKKTKAKGCVDRIAGDAKGKWGELKGRAEERRRRKQEEGEKKR